MLLSLAELCSSRKVVQSTESYPHNILIYRDCVGRKSHPASQVSSLLGEERTHNLWIKNTNSHTCCEAHMSMCRAEARMDVGALRRTPRHNIWNMDERTLGEAKGITDQRICEPGRAYVFPQCIARPQNNDDEPVNMHYPAGPKYSDAAESSAFVLFLTGPLPGGKGTVKLSSKASCFGPKLFLPQWHKGSRICIST